MSLCHFPRNSLNFYNYAAFIPQRNICFSLIIRLTPIWLSILAFYVTSGIPLKTSWIIHQLLQLALVAFYRYSACHNF